MEYFIIAVLVCAALVAVAWPLVTRGRYRFELEDVLSFGDVRQLNYLNSKKALVFDNMKELDFEYEMGKLSDEDYAALRRDYLQEAQDVVQAIDRLKTREEIEELIESEVRSRRRIDS